MAQKKVYGIGENKCRVEVVPKESAMIKDDVIIVETSKFTINYSSNDPQMTQVAGINTNLPTGYNKDNVSLLSVALVPVSADDGYESIYVGKVLSLPLYDRVPTPDGVDKDFSINANVTLSDTEAISIRIMSNCPDFSFEGYDLATVKVRLTFVKTN